MHGLAPARDVSLAAVTVLNTAIESCPGQLRYRYPLEHLALAITAAGTVLLVRAAVALLPTRASSPEVSGPAKPAI
jgi:hypothetical protein